MKTSKRVLSVVASIAMVASTFSAFAVTANADEGSAVFEITAPEQEITAVAVKAVYGSDGVLQSVSAEDVKIGAGQTQVTVPAEIGTKVMLWNSLEEMKSLSAADIAGKAPLGDAAGEVLVNEDFSAVTDSWGFTGNAGAAVAEEVLSLADSTNANGTQTTIKTMDTSVSSADALSIKFDWASDVESGKDRSSGLELRDADGALLFAMYGKGGAKADSGIKYATAEAGGSISWQHIEGHTTGKFYTIDINVNFITGKLSGTVTDTAAKSVLVTIPESDIAAKNFAQIKAGNYYSAAPMSLDNVVISSADTYAAKFDVTGNGDGTGVKGAEIVIGKKTFVTDAEGKAEMLLPAGEYSYTVTAAKHEIYEGTLTAETGASVSAEMVYVGDTSPTTIEISGGDEGIYKPKSGSNSTVNKYTAAIYDQTGQLMEEEAVEWSLVAAAEGASISSDAIVTVTDEFPVADINGETIVVKAASKTNPEVYEIVNLHVYDVARVTSFDIIGPSAIKDGFTATYTIGNVKDQYGVDYTGDATYTLTATENVTVDGMNVTPKTGTVQTKEFTITATSSDTDYQGNKVTATKIVTAYAFDFYESQVGGSAYGTVRTSEVNGETYTVWPASSGATATQTITLPAPVEMTPGTAKLITYSTAWTNKTVGSQERYITFDFANEAAKDIKIGYHGGVYVDPAKVDGNFTSDISLGAQGAASTFEETLILVKTDIDGNSTASISYAGGTPVVIELGSNIGTLNSIAMTGGKGAPDDRLLAIKDIKISDSDIAEVEITGSDTIAKISGSVATKTYEASVFALADGETFAWAVKDADGNDVDGVGIDENGVLSVSDTVAANTVLIITYTSELDPAKSASKEVTVKDFANIASFTINGPAAVNAGDSAVYSVADIVDEYGDAVNMAPLYEITSGADIASIDAENGTLTTDSDKAGNVTISVTLGNPGKTKTLTKVVVIGKYSASGTANTASVDVNVSELANYAANTKYLVTTATADRVMVAQTEVAHNNGIVTVDMTGAVMYEVSPIYEYTNVGNVASGKEVPVCDGLYDFTFVKSGGSRGDIFVNDCIVGNNVDQNGKQRVTGGTVYTVKDVKVTGGSAVVRMTDDANLSSITVKKAPSILERKTHVYIAGDSTAASYNGRFGSDVEIIGGLPRAGQAQTGWGQVFERFVGDGVNVTNIAESGNYAEGWYNGYFKSGVINQAEPGDYFIVSFGINDRNYSNADKMAATLTNMIKECREVGVIPVLVSSQRWSGTYGDGAAQGWEGYFDRVISVAEENGALYVNLTDLTAAYFDTIGKDKVTQNYNIYYGGASQDALHLSYFGAMKCAELLAQNIADQQAAGKVTASGESFAGLTINKNASYTFTLVDNTTETLKVD